MEQNRAGTQSIGLVTGEEARVFLARIEKSSALLRKAATEMGTIFWGQDEIIDLTIACMVAGGNMLAEGPPSAGKTHLVSNVAKVMGLDFKRVQCTPDLMPGDIIGSQVQDKETGGFRFLKGPLFTEFLMADEINRAGPKVQSAFLEAMQERKVTVAGETMPLPQPFLMMATQNPGFHDGTYPLPEAQRDRFMLRLNFDYPDEATEMRIMRETGAKEKMTVSPVITKGELIEMQNLLDQMPIGEELVGSCVKLTRLLRPNLPDAPDYVKKSIEEGPSTRAVIAFAKIAKARAMIDGRPTPNMADIKAIAVPVLQHRTKMNYSSDQDGAFQAVLKQAMQSLGMK